MARSWREMLRAVVYGIDRKWSRATKARPKWARLTTRPRIEVLEDRTVPSVVFTSEYGDPYTDIGNNVLMGNIPVYLIFADDKTTGFGYDGSLSAATITTAVQNLLNSTLLDSLSEYHASTHAFLNANPLSTSPARKASTPTM